MVGCTKTEETLYITHCHNSFRDSTEDAMDCGGVCKPCKLINPTCTVTGNKLSIGAINYTTTINGIGRYDSNNNLYTIDGNYEGGSYTITVSGKTPSLYTELSIVAPTFSLTEEQTTIMLKDASLGNMDLQTKGKLYITKLNGVYYATICDARGYSFVTGSNYSIIGKLPFN